MASSKKSRHRVTLKEISRITGVSQPVVSAILGRLNNPTVRFSPETREKVLTVAKQLNYRPNRGARTLLRQRHDIIGLLIANMGNLPHLTPTWLLNRAAHFGQILAFEYVDTSIPNPPLPLFLREDSVDGVILFEDLGPHIYREINKIAIPAIYVNTDYQESANCVLFDEPGAMKIAIDKFEALGCTRVAIFHPQSSHYFTRERSLWFEKHAAEKKLPALIHTMPRNHTDIRTCYDQALTHIRQLFQKTTEKIGILIHDTELAPALYHLAATYQRKIPDDLAVIAMHQQKIQPFLIPPLSCLQLNTQQLAYFVVDRLNDLIDGKELTGPYRFPYTLVDRRSTGGEAC